VPSWIAKKLSDEKTQLAYDDIRKLVDSNKGLGQTFVEGLLPGAGVAKGAKLAAKVGTSSAIGAASGLAGSDTGSELAGAATGAAISGTTAGIFSPEMMSKMQGLPVFKKIVKKFTRPETTVKEVGDSTVEQIESTARRWKAKGTFDDIPVEWEKLGQARGEAYVAHNFNKGTMMPTKQGSDLMARRGERLTAAHEFLHGQFADVSKDLNIDYRKLLDYINNKVSPEAKDFITPKLIKKYKYDESQIADELVPWMLNLANSKEDREYLGVSKELMSVIKKDLKNIQKWAKDIDEETLIKEIGTGPAGLKSAAMKSPTEELRTADNFFADLTPDAVKKLEGMSVTDLVKEIPGLEINKTKKSGMEVFNVVVDGVDKGSAMSEEGARTKALKWLKEAKNKEEVDFKRY
jgi:hypothetical protein